MSEIQKSISCPYCGAPMFLGKSEVKGDFVGFLLAGFSIQHLWFRSDARKIKKKIVASSSETPAHMCDNCGAVAIPPAKTLIDRIGDAAQRVSKYVDERKKEN